MGNLIMKHISQNTIDKIGASISREIEENLLNGLLFGTDCTAQIMQDTTKSQGEVNWSDKTADQILDDINQAFWNIMKNSTEVKTEANRTFKELPIAIPVNLGLKGTA